MCKITVKICLNTKLATLSMIFSEFHFKFKSQIDFQQIFVIISCPSSRTRRVLVSNDGYIRYSNLGRIVDVKRVV